MLFKTYDQNKDGVLDETDINYIIKNNEHTLSNTLTKEVLT